MKRHIANIITGCRIFCSVLMLFLSVKSAGFRIVYLICGLSDIADGIVARKTGCISKFGEKLDTLADFIFLAVALLKFLPVILIPGWLWIWISMIAAIKFSSIVREWIKRKRLLAMHSVLNKITGATLFLLPPAVHLMEIQYCLPVVCSLATFAAIQEGICIGKTV